MPLPKGKLSTVTVELSGGPVEVHSLSVGQAERIAEAPAEEMTALYIAAATSTSLPEVKEWMADANTPTTDVAVLLEAVKDVSLIGQGARFQDRQSDGPVAERTDV